MSDLSLGDQNKTNRQTELIAEHMDTRGYGSDTAFHGGVILQVKPITNRDPSDGNTANIDGINGVASGYGRGLVGEGLGGGLFAHSALGDGATGISDFAGKSGVFGFNSRTEDVAFGVFGRCDSSEGAGVSGRNDSTGDAVSGFSPNGIALHGISEWNTGVFGTTGANGQSGVVGENTGGTGTSFDGRFTGVTGRANTRIGGIGVSGESAHGIGVSGSGGVFGASLQGKQAPLRLVPSESSGPPASGAHLMGELYVDSVGDLFFCKVSGSPGKWAKLA